MKKNKLDKYIESLKEIKDKLVIVTGANSGIGYYISRFALLKGARLIMACRNKERAESAKEKLIVETGNPNIDIALYDQSDFSSIDSFVSTLEDKYSDFYALVLNAGILKPKEKVDEYHISLVYKTNFLGAYYLLDKLQPLINNSTQERRIIIQGSTASFAFKYKNSNKLIYGELEGWKEYSLTKLGCSNLYAYYRDQNINLHVKYLLCEPGAAATNLFSSFPQWAKNITLWFLKSFTNTPEEGALSAIKLLCDLTANGDYYYPRHTLSGLPKKHIFKRKYIIPKIIDDGKEVIKTYGKEN